MKPIQLILFFCLFTFSIFSQEICDNGVDDDGDGLIDLNDTSDCYCFGLIYVDTSFEQSLIPNSSFEDRYYCPITFSLMDALVSWIQPSFPTSDFMHTCDYVPGMILTQGLLPFPDGEGITGAIYGHDWKEYIGSCLLDTLFAGENYELSFYVASSPTSGILSSCNDGIITYSDVNITLFGNGSCAVFPFSGYDCPPSSEGWSELGNVTYTPNDMWEFVSISFTPASDVTSVVLGPPCSLPPDYVQNSSTPGACVPYFVYDKLDLKEHSGPTFGILNSYDTPCATNSILSIQSDMNLSSGSCQWYYNGIAMLGETDTHLSLDHIANMNGKYTVTFQTGTDCYGATYNVNYFHSIDTTIIEELSCGPYFWDLTHSTYDISGIYETSLQAVSGCDSIVRLDLSVNPNVLEVVDKVMCDGDTLVIHGVSYFTEGNYEQFFSNENGCVDINITIVDSVTKPKIVVDPILCLGDSIVLRAEVPSSYMLMWTLPTGNVVQSNSIAVPADSPAQGTYFLNEGAIGCISGSDSLILDKYLSSALIDVIIPNVITPNNDDTNEELLVEGIPFGCEYSIQLVNRWGEIVYIQTESSKPFTGFSSIGRELSSGTYFYTFRMKELSKFGFIEIIR